ncbi:MAG: nicotinate phosphoribosyltransferase [Halanaeroarchaeum sp.]
MTAFDVVPPEAIEDGRATDAYFDRTVRTLDHAEKDPLVTAEVTADQFPEGDFEVVAGLKDAIALLEGLPIDVDALPEGTLFDGGPVLRITGHYLDFARYETSLLGFLSHASGMATRALEARMAAPDSTVLSFGARHVHPSIATVVERSALLAGLDGISHVAAGEVLGYEASGTMPHALVICFGRGNQEAAWTAFDDAVDEEVPRVALCDTYSDEADETVRAANALGDALDSVRLDTTASRRGNFEHIVREVRWELDARGFEDVGIFVSGGLDPEALRDLREYVEGFGVGGHISNADPVDFALDIVSVNGDPAAKRGKLSGAKAVYRTPEGDHRVVPEGRDVPGESLMEPMIRDGEVVTGFDIEEAAERALADAERVGFGTPEE